jgi:formamidopyrimidine-DNA glycosylase
MPELPEVESVVRGLRDDVVGCSFTCFETTWPRQIRPYTPKAFASRLVGQRIITLGRRAKYIVFTLSDDVLFVHLKMTGRLYIKEKWPDEDDTYVRARFGLDDGNELLFSDMRKFGRIQLVADAEEITGSLGPEPLSDSFTLDDFRDRLTQRQGTIKPLLMNQQFVAGVGNIYADESLWLARIDPRRKADTLNSEEIERLYDAIRKVLEAGIAREGASVNWYRKPDGTTGSQQNYFYVYDQVDKPCPRCGSLVHKIRLGQRGTHFCPTCQV